jgi:hypothetical protein
VEVAFGDQRLSLLQARPLDVRVINMSGISFNPVVQACNLDND